ncbi:MAG TPA: hypothetical protein DCS01_00730 [Idiomarina abyssalis]|uniref:hypothetical protein n=1 Tax=Idiomarina TaxID=135575 RepID=UPI000C3CF607|nr:MULTISPECIES: hypothetical protein [Idiomarina]MAB22050.1 hypothetical protein [Idiomarina sp.]MBH93289.1 hypothetical protein [Idiomarina sp.]HAS13804.1 hypothetical protein [Idiomarina abyssalis]
MSEKDLQSRAEEFIAHDLALIKNHSKWKRYARIVANALSVIPWVGPILASGANVQGELEQEKVNELYEEWLHVHKQKTRDLFFALDEVSERLESVHDEYNERIQSEEYLTLVRRAFRSWDEAETQEKRAYVINLISNAAASHLCPDDLIRLFHDWLDKYHETHFKVVRAIYQNPGVTRLGIWQSVSNDIPREDSAEADLYRLLIHDLSTGRVIRQFRQTTYDGKFVKKTNKARSKSSLSSTMESAFENTKPYQLTELGSQFVHYTMNQVVERIEK